MTFITGFLMAIADSVPGVSGGTIAYILKRYEPLFMHINNILKGNFEQQSINFLIKLGSGWVIGFISAIFIITAIFEQHIYQISSLFLGFITISLLIVMRQEKKVLNFNFKNTLISVVAAIIVVLLVLFQNSGAITFAPSAISLTSYLYIFVTGIIAISAMLLPGISGSAVLMIFGVYFIIIDAIHKFLTFDFSMLPILIVFGLGILCGAVFAVKTISSLFANHRSKIIHLILGLLVGSLYAIIYGPTSIEAQNLAPLGLDTFSISFFFLGVILLAILEFVVSKE